MEYLATFRHNRTNRRAWTQMDSRGSSDDVLESLRGIPAIKRGILHYGTLLLTQKARCCEITY